MPSTWMRPAVAIALLACLAIAGTCQAQRMQGPACAQIRAACKAAGFTAGAAKSGTGIVKDCINPILNGVAAPPRSTIPLPQVDPGAVAECRAQTNVPGGTVSNATPAAPLAPPSGNHPNIVMILVDDYSLNLIDEHMPNLAALIRDGARFANYFVTDSLCCPSRSSIFTGKLPHDTQVFMNTGPIGGYGSFMSHGNVDHTFAVALHDAGYATAMMGKYLNGYEPARNGAPAGWSEWDVAGNGYPEFNYTVNENGKVVKYGNTPADYGVDVLSNLGDAFVRANAKRPFFLEIATFAPHAPYIPAPRDADKFPGLTNPRTADYDAAPNATAPGWLKEITPLGPADEARMDKAFRMRVQADQAVDQMLGRLRATLAELGIDKTTYVVFTSDNGYHMGDFRLRPGKMTPFDLDIRVPLVIAGPGVAAGGTLDEIAENIDLAPTYVDLAHVPPGPLEPDGRSLADLMHGVARGGWRNMALIEHRHPTPDKADPDIQEPLSGNPPSYEALRTEDGMYVEYDDTAHETGYYDLKSDPLELNNIAGSLPAGKLKQLHDSLQQNAACHGASACSAAQSLSP